MYYFLSLMALSNWALNLRILSAVLTDIMNNTTNYVQYKHFSETYVNNYKFGDKGEICFT